MLVTSVGWLYQSRRRNERGHPSWFHRPPEQRRSNSEDSGPLTAQAAEEGAQQGPSVAATKQRQTARQRGKM